MKMNNWSPEERQEFAAICARAWAAATTSAGRRTEFIKLIAQARAAGKFFASDIQTEASNRGHEAILKSWHKAHNRIPVSYGGTVLIKPRMVGTKVLTSTGQIVDTQSLFDYLTWEQLEAKAVEYRLNIAAFKADLYTVEKLLDLRNKVPYAANPAAACAVLGTTVEDYLAS
jgi:hypothetical protein